MEGIAFDCIAELFQRDESGTFIELEVYFSENRALELIDEQEAQHYFRRLVFSSLNEGIYRLYRENDPVLGRIIRNLKIVAQSMGDLKQFERLGQTYCYTCGEAERNDQLSEYPIDQLQTELALARHAKKNTQAYVRKFFEILNHQQQYRRFYALIDIAIIIKRIFVQRGTSVQEMVSTDESLLRHDLENILRRSTIELKRSLHQRYVETGKIPFPLFQSYAQALEDMMFDVFANNDGSDLSHVDYLKKYVSDLTLQEYRRTHRTHFEYMVRVARRFVKERVRELL
ncbi:MAG: hypothetical protein NTU47_00355 [Ignavibacteriales bacterium]|nr:hypothetical protein [Ignavibacteriales bacterium]